MMANLIKGMKSGIVKHENTYFEPKDTQETPAVFALLDGQWDVEMESLKKKARVFMDQLCTHVMWSQRKW